MDKKKKPPTEKQIKQTNKKNPKTQNGQAFTEKHFPLLTPAPALTPIMGVTRWGYFYSNQFISPFLDRICPTLLRMSKYIPKFKSTVRYSCCTKKDKGWRKNEEVKLLVHGDIVAELT